MRLRDPNSTSAYIADLTWKEDGRTVHSPGSNFWTTEDGFNVEVEFQAEKHDGHPMRQKIIRAIGAKDGPYAAKQRARAWRLTPDEQREWDGRRLEVMRALVHRKAQRSEGFREWLDATESMLIVEGNWWHDNFWGNCRCGATKCARPGSNWLGSILMEERAMLNKTPRR